MSLTTPSPRASVLLLLQLLIVFLSPVLGKGEDLEWRRCEEDGLRNYTTVECSTFTVPLDHKQRHDLRTVDLELARLRARTSSSKGTILFNFGGPGFESRKTLAQVGTYLLESTGGAYDLVAFDPRGTANTIPFNCTQDAIELDSWIRGSSVLFNSSACERASIQLWAHNRMIGQNCLLRQPDIAKHLGTVSVAYDTMAITEALNRDGMLRFWGMSYGTILGTTLADLFPDRVARIVLDGVENAKEWYNSPMDFERWTDTDAALREIWSSCIKAGPDACELAAHFNDTTLLESSVWGLVDKLRENPVTLRTNETAFVLDYDTIKVILLQSLYGSSTWLGLTKAISKLLVGGAPQEVANAVAPLMPPTGKGRLVTNALSMANFGIRCGDRRPRVSSLPKIRELAKDLGEVSRLAADVEAGISSLCAQWPFQADSYTGPKELVKSAQPILIVGNSLDGITSFKSAVNASLTFERSVVLEIEGNGHTSISVPSLCARRATAAYFVNGTLPTPGTRCTVDVRPFESLDKNVKGEKESIRRSYYRRVLGSP